MLKQNKSRFFVLLTSLMLSHAVLAGDLGNGSKCKHNRECASRYCVSSLCQKDTRGDAGTTCQHNGYCKSGTCLNGSCTAPKVKIKHH